MIKKMRNNGQWTEARFNSFIKSALRAASRRWPPKFGALKKAYTCNKKNIKTNRMSKHYTCAQCRGLFPTSEVEVDHINPVVPVTGFTTWGEVIERMFCEEEGFQVLCRTCHSVKSTAERAKRKKYNG